MTTSLVRAARPHRRVRAVVGMVAALALALPGAGAAPDPPRNLIVMISDGCGGATFDLARRVAGRPLALDAVRRGRVRTASADARVTDSAAGATAYASGVRTVNRRIGRDPLGRPLASWFVAAADRGMATGVVVTTDVTDATPAAFYARVHDRRAQDSVAVQLIERRIDVVLGGGRRWFAPAPDGGERKDGRDLIAEARARGDRVVTDASQLAAAGEGRLLGLFAHGSLDYRLDRDAAQPGLEAMTRIAIARLARAPNGFVLVVEGSRIDHAGHQNDPAAHAREALEYDETARAVLDWARRDGRTLVVATSDHETGGLRLARPRGLRSERAPDPGMLRNVRASVARMANAIAVSGDAEGVLAREAGLTDLDAGDRAKLSWAGNTRDRLREALAGILNRHAGVSWSGEGHTAADVPLFAAGPGSERLRGTLANRDVGRRVAEAMGLPWGVERAAERAGTR